MLYCAAHADTPEDFKALSPGRSAESADESSEANDGDDNNQCIGIDEVIDVRDDAGHWQMGMFCVLPMVVSRARLQGSLSC